MKKYVYHSALFQNVKDTLKDEEMRRHRKERKQLGRSAFEITKGIKQRPKFWKGERVQ